MTSAELDAAASRFAAVERRLFEILGGWAPTVAEPDVKLTLRVASFRHAWHAELWDGLVRVAVDAGEGVGRRLEPLAGAASTVERLDAYYRDVLPPLVAEYEAWWERAAGDVAAGGPLRRVLGLVLADDRAELAAAPVNGRQPEQPERRGIH